MPEFPFIARIANKDLNQPSPIDEWTEQPIVVWLRRGIRDTLTSDGGLVRPGPTGGRWATGMPGYCRCVSAEPRFWIVTDVRRNEGSVTVLVDAWLTKPEKQNCSKFQVNPPKLTGRIWIQNCHAGRQATFAWQTTERRIGCLRVRLNLRRHGRHWRIASIDDGRRTVGRRFFDVGILQVKNIKLRMLIWSFFTVSHAASPRSVDRVNELVLERDFFIDAWAWSLRPFPG